MSANKERLLSLQNPSYLDYHRLTSIFEVNVLSTPTTLTSPQLKNFYLHLALERGWYHFFSSHMNTFALSVEEHARQDTYQSLYMRAVDVLRELLRPGRAPWALHSFANNGPMLVNVGSCIRTGVWDTTISDHMSDCDFYQRLKTHRMEPETSIVGEAYSVNSVLSDLVELYSRSSYKSTGDIIADVNQMKVEFNTSTYQTLRQKIIHLAKQRPDNGVPNCKEGG